jgi:ubiquinone/menaquinone biosynthesis C-methylase UbiE
MLRQVRARLGARAPACVQASGSVLPFRDGAFDHVFLVTVLGEIPDQAGALRECHRVLRSRGTLAVTEALPDPDYVRTPVLRRRAAAAGFVAGKRLGSWFNYTHRFVRP